MKMPITKDRRAVYPPDWKAISKRIRFERAGGRCECIGECGLHTDRCLSVHGEFVHRGGIDLKYGEDNTHYIRVVLTTAHRVHGIDCSDANLFAACQKCHLNYDAKLHASNARRTIARKAGQIELPIESDPK